MNNKLVPVTSSCIFCTAMKRFVYKYKDGKRIMKVDCQRIKSGLDCPELFPHKIYRAYDSPSKISKGGNHEMDLNKR